VPLEIPHIIPSFEASSFAVLIASSSLTIRESWIKYCANVKGKLIIDNGASLALNNRKSLLAVGIKQVEGSFKHGEVVEICLENKTIIAKGISLFDNMQIKKFIDKEHVKNQVVVHANDIVINGD
jgi:glutamate 5-kinase